MNITEVPATFTKPLADKYFYEKETLTLECELTKANVQVCWQKDGLKIISDSRVQMSFYNCLHKLEIADATMDDGGTYICVCGKEKTECQITVEGTHFCYTCINIKIMTSMLWLWQQW